MARINLLGHGKIMQAMAKILAPCDIYDDKFSEIMHDKFGNRLLPSKEILKIAESRLDSANQNNPSLRNFAKQSCGNPQVFARAVARSNHPPIEKAKDSQGGLPRRFCESARNDEFLDSSLRKCSAQNDNVGTQVAESSKNSADSALSKQEANSSIVDEFSRSCAASDAGSTKGSSRKRGERERKKSPQDAEFVESTFSIISPGIPPTHILAQNAPNIISEYDFFASQMPPSVWISGTNGKTTTTQMTALLLRDFGAVSGGNIGTPLCEMDANAPFWVLETSSFMLHYTNIATPKIYALLPIDEDHLSWHGDFERYKEAKLKPLKTMSANSTAIIPKTYADSAICADFKGKIYFYEDAESLAKIFDINAHNLRFKGAFLLDSILALAICKLVTGKIDYDLMNSFKIDSHKIEEFFDAQNRLFIDDSKATNISATIEALKIYKEKFIFLILGGDNKGVSLAPLVEILRAYKVKVFAIGACENHIKDLCVESSVPCEVCGDLQSAVATIKREFNDANNQVCLLSPACASLDQFKSYSERGDLFKKYALQIHLAATF